MTTDTPAPASAPITPVGANPEPGETARHESRWLDPISDALPHVDHRARRRAVPATQASAGRYLALTHDGETMLLALEREVTHIGRGFAADVRLEEHRVSRRHAILVQRGARVRLLDDRSANGTFVNGRRIIESDLEDGDVILIGPLALRYVEISASASADAVPGRS